ncbi:MAG: ATP-binding protein [Oligoflexia bacterium]|nr:ATP-binding protein [Oligoflexia bacterium]
MLTINESFSPRAENIDNLCLKVRNNFFNIISSSDIFAIELLLREALANAMIHGCKQDPSKKIYCSCCLSQNRFDIEVRDEGQGFEWPAFFRENQGDKKILDDHGRGFVIYRHYASSVKFNQSGNVISISREVSCFSQEKMGMENKQEMFFAFEGDIVSSNVNDLRDKFKSLLAQGVVTELVLDLDKTIMVDSSGLGLFIALHNSLSKMQGKLKLVNLSSDILKLFHTVGLDQHFLIVGKK